MSRQTDWAISIPDHVSWTTSNDEILVYNGRSEEICGLDAVAADAFVQLAALGPTVTCEMLLISVAPAKISNFSGTVLPLFTVFVMPFMSTGELKPLTVQAPTVRDADWYVMA